MKTLHVLKETFLSSLPLAAVILIVCVFIAPMRDANDYVKLAVGYAGVVVGQAIFLVGIDISILPVGKLMGESLIKLKKILFIIFFGLLFGLVAEAAEPAVSVFARLSHMVLEDINERVLVWVMASGIGCFVGVALYRIVKDMDIKRLFVGMYSVILLLLVFVPKQFVAVAFDGSGSTTGDVSVPFMLALGVGVSATISKRKTSDDVFGIIGVASLGPIFTIFLYGIIFRAAHGGIIPPERLYSPGMESFAYYLAHNLGSVALALTPVLTVFLLFQFIFIKLPKRELLKILLGTVPVFAGLLFFLSGIDFGFAFAGEYIGEVFLDPMRPEWYQWLLLLLGFVLGAAITLSEPAVTVLGKQLELLTNGHIKKNTIRGTLAIGIGVASMLSIVKILTQINILWFLIPLYALALYMTKFSSKLFVGLAFDSGGVSSGSLTSAFLTPLTLGVAQAMAVRAGENAPSLLTNGFGIIAFISVTPLIAVQTLGIIYDKRYQKVRRLTAAHELEELEELLPRPIDTESAEVREFES